MFWGRSMHLCFRAVLASAALALSLHFAGSAEAKPVFVKDGEPFRIGDGQPGGQSDPRLVFWDTHTGFIATWLNYRSASTRLAFAAFFLSGATPVATSQLDGNGGPTQGKNATSTAPVSFADGASLALFSADRPGAAASAKRDIFAQPMANGPFGPSGESVEVNEDRPGAQDSVLATRLSNGNALVVFSTSVGGGIHARVLDSDSMIVGAEREVTVSTAGTQRPIALASLTGGRSVLVYLVKQGNTEKVYAQRLDANLKRQGKAALLKSSSGDARYGGAGVAGLANGGYVALWFVKGGGGKANLKGKVFSANGAAGATKTIGSASVQAKSSGVPQLAFTDDNELVVATDGFSAGRHSVDAWLLTAGLKRQLGPVALAKSANPLSAGSLVWMGSENFVVAWTAENSDPKKTRAMAQRFHFFDCGRC